MPRCRFLQLVGPVAGAILFPVAYSVPVVDKEALVIAGSKLSDIKPVSEPPLSICSVQSTLNGVPVTRAAITQLAFWRLARRGY